MIKWQQTGISRATFSRSSPASRTSRVSRGRGPGKLLALFFILGCSSRPVIHQIKNAPRIDASSYEVFQKADYRAHLSLLGEHFLNDAQTRKVRPSPAARRYLNKLTDHIILSNESVLGQIENATVNIMRDRRPYYFSVPQGHLFLSTGLIGHYIKSEANLAAVLTKEMIRSAQLIYPKKIIVPVGHVGLERILSLINIQGEVKSELNKWTFLALRRSKLGADQYLFWLQTESRNALDFSLMQKNPRSDSREEFLFKSFLVENRLNVRETVEKQSPEEFYEFLDEIRQYDGA